MPVRLDSLVAEKPVRLDSLSVEEPNVYQGLDPEGVYDKAGEVWDAALDMDISLLDTKTYPTLLNDPQDVTPAFKEEDAQKTSTIAPWLITDIPEQFTRPAKPEGQQIRADRQTRSFWKKFKGFFISGRPELPPDADRMEKIDRAFDVALGGPLRTFVKVSKGMLLNTPDIAWAVLKRIVPEDVWDSEVRHMTLDEAMDWAAGYDPSGFQKAAGEIGEFVGRVRTIGPLLNKAGIVTNEAMTALGKASETALVFGGASAVEQISIAASQVIDPTETEYGYEGAIAVLKDMALGAVFSLVGSGVKGAWSKLTPSEHARALKTLGLKKGATQAEITKAANKMALNTHPDKVKGLRAEFEKVIKARDTLRAKPEQDIIFRGQKVKFTPKLLPGEEVVSGAVVKAPTTAVKAVTPAKAVALEAAQPPGEAVLEGEPSPEITPTLKPKEAVKAVKDRISFKIPKKPFTKKIQDTLLQTDKQFRDEFAVLRKAVKQADLGEIDPADNPVELAVAFTQKSSAKTRGFVLEGTTDLAGNKTGKGLREIVAPHVGNMDDLSTYLIATRALNLQSRDIKTGITPEDARVAFDELNSPGFQQAAREITDWNNAGIDLLVESGAITPEAGQSIKDANPVYVPFFREFEEGELPKGAGSGVAKAGQPIKRIKGSERKIVNPFESMIQQMERIISTSQRAAVSNSLARLVQEKPEGFSDFIQTAKAPVRPISVTPKEIKLELADLGVDLSGLDKDELDTMIRIFRPIEGERPQQGLFKLRVEGEDKFFKIEPELADVLMGMDQYKLPWFWDIVAGKPTRAVKLGATGLNATFGLIRNPLRDIQTFTVTSEFAKAGPLSAIGGVGKDVVTKFSGVVENFGFAGIPKSSDVQKFSALGGEMSGFIGRDRRGVKHLTHEMMASNGVRYTLHTFRHPIDAMRNLFSITESGVRIGEFGAALKQGEKIYGKGSLSASVFALNAAQDVTVNFSRHGKIGKQLNEVVPFFNVAIQAPDKIIRSFRERPVKSTIAAISTLTVPALLLWWRNKDKPWYRNMTAYEKANYLHFESPEDEDTIIRFPVPYELGHIFQALPVAILDQKYNDSPNEVKDVFKEVVKLANPFDIPAVARPMFDIARNEDFAGRPIVPKSEEGNLPADQYGPRTTELMKVIGKQVGLSPAQIEHAVNSYSGGLYNRVSRMLDNNDMETTLSDTPILGPLFLRDPFAPRKQVEEFYRRRDKLNRQFKSDKISRADNVDMIVRNNFSPILSIKFDQLQETKTVEARKKVWSQIEKLIETAEKINVNTQNAVQPLKEVK